MVLGAAAVIGRMFSYQLLVQHRGLGICRQRGVRSELPARLQTLCQEQLIRQRMGPPEAEYAFKHELTWEVAYGRLLRKDRRRMHRRIAEALEELPAERVYEQVEVLAHHWTQAGVIEKAIHYRVRAGERARCLGASLEAVGFLESALNDMPDPASPELTKEVANIHEGLGDVYLENLARHDEARRHYERFFAMASSPESRARAARKLGVVLLLQGHVAEAREYCQTGAIIAGQSAWSG